MIDFLKRYFAGKKVLILGFGIEGQSTYRTLRDLFPDKPLTIADKDPGILKKHPWLGNDPMTTLIAGEHYLDSIGDAGLIIKSPGITDHPKFLHATDRTVTSQTELFLSHFKRQIIGVTGTKGKSTTSSLLYHIISLYTSNTILAGNIGAPLFDFAGKADGNTVIICELSAHQLDGITCSPHMAILLNMYQEHLDYYKSFAAYREAKFNIVRHQEPGDIFIYNGDDPIILRQLNSSPVVSRTIPFSLHHLSSSGCYAVDNETIHYHDTGGSTSFHIGVPPVKGEHNFMNIMAVIAACKVTGLPDDIILHGIGSFHGLEHRLEYIGTYHGIQFYNDSIATVPEATMYAVKTLQTVDTLILGGFDRGVDFSALIRFLGKSGIRNLIFTGDAGKRMLAMCEAKKFPGKILFFAADMDEVAGIAIRHTGQGKICLLSPAAASFGVYNNYSERGDAFRKAISK
jgi:UDP-N-acetylmuramoylalanine--D-glutamate ligase